MKNDGDSKRVKKNGENFTLIYARSVHGKILCCGIKHHCNGRYQHIAMQYIIVHAL